jgi:hypothetical protein
MKTVRSEKPHLMRILDANFNRSREGLRVCEDLRRFVCNDTRGTRALRRLRHNLSHLYKSLPLASLVTARDTHADSERGFNSLEQDRLNWQDIYQANMQRSKEAVRVLEEVSKVLMPRHARILKTIRFKLYAYEKEHLTTR